MKIIPVILIKNEELWIRHIIKPLVDVFEHVIVADTGSTDTTVEQVQPMSGVILRLFNNLSPKDIGKCREWMQQEAEVLFGATHIFLVDGDELYPRKYLEFIRDYPMPENALSGFTWGIEYTELDNGECWMLGNNGEPLGLNRQAIISVDSKWSGSYPFESPSTYKPGDPTNYYWRSPDANMHFHHIHQMVRSTRDTDVFMRVEKRFQFGLKNAPPEIKPSSLWLRSREEYKDE